MHMTRQYLPVSRTGPGSREPREISNAICIYFHVTRGNFNHLLMHVLFCRLQDILEHTVPICYKAQIFLLCLNFSGERAPAQNRGFCLWWILWTMVGEGWFFFCRIKHQVKCIIACSSGIKCHFSRLLMFPFHPILQWNFGIAVASHFFTVRWRAVSG